jgi:hypothetical protein
VVAVIDGKGSARMREVRYMRGTAHVVVRPRPHLTSPPLLLPGLTT